MLLLFEEPERLAVCKRLWPLCEQGDQGVAGGSVNPSRKLMYLIDRSDWVLFDLHALELERDGRKAGGGKRAQGSCAHVKCMH